MVGKTFFAAAFCCLFLGLAAAPAQAATYWDWDCWCWRDSGSTSGTTITASNGAKYATLTETVPYTGRTHLVLVMDGSFFPKRLFADYGDRILFVNKSDTSLKVEASNGSWTSNSLGYEKAYLLLVQSGVTGSFRTNASGCYGCSSVSGEFKIAALPSEVNYWEDTLTTTAMLPMFEIPSTLLATTLTWVANLQTVNGITPLVTGAT